MNDGDAGHTSWQSDECVLRGSLLSLGDGNKADHSKPEKLATESFIVRYLSGHTLSALSEHTSTVTSNGELVSAIRRA